MTVLQVKNIKIKNSVDASDKIAQDGVNVTPRIVAQEPVVKNGFKGIFKMLSEFVAVGGDFV